MGGSIYTNIYGDLADPNYGFSGRVSSGVSISQNLYVLEKMVHLFGLEKTVDWWYNQVRSNRDNHLPSDYSWDYKRQNKYLGEYDDFGNYNYAVTAKFLGIPDTAINMRVTLSKKVMVVDGLSRARM